VLKKSTTNIPRGKLAVKIEAVKKREDNALRERKKEAMKIGVGIPPKAQLIFNKLEKIFPQSVRWEGKNIAIFDDMKLSPPYTPDSCMGGSKEQLERVRKMIRNVQMVDR